MEIKKSKSLYFISIACVLHCIAAPFLIIIAPLFGSILENHFFEYSLLIISIICGSFIIYKGYCAHKKIHLFLLYLTGAFLWILHLLFEHYDIAGAKLSFYIGTLIVLIAYYISHRLCCPATCSHH